jgi:hypothetical protein
MFTPATGATPLATLRFAVANLRAGAQALLRAIPSTV